MQIQSTPRRYTRDYLITLAATIVIYDITQIEINCELWCWCAEFVCVL